VEKNLSAYLRESKVLEEKVYEKRNFFYKKKKTVLCSVFPKGKPPISFFKISPNQGSKRIFFQTKK